MTTAVTTILSVPGVIALVNLIKSRYPLGDWAALLAFALGIGLNIAAWAAGAAYAGFDPFTVVCIGALVGLGASGIYDTKREGPATVYEAKKPVELFPGDQPIFAGIANPDTQQAVAGQISDPASPTFTPGNPFGGTSIIGVQRASRPDSGDAL